MEVEFFQDLCRELNMDKEAEERAWASFTDVRQKFSLEGDQRQWVCCALYAACRESYRPTVGGSNEVVRGNCVALTKLLRSCNVSIYDFITKMKNWCDLAMISTAFSDQVDRLAGGIIITLNLFKLYNKIFYTIFVVPQHEKTNKKSRPIKCSANKLYDLCWCLFLCAKNEGSNDKLDLVSSLHLLLCCINLIYVNALTENRVELINANFEGVPATWNTPEFNPAEAHNHCIIEHLCQFTDGLLAQAKAMKHNLRQTIVTFIETKTLHGNRETLLGIISNTNFEPNFKSLNSAYEQYVLSMGEFDERILLNKASKKSSNCEPSGVINQSMRSLAPGTPFTRKQDLPKKGNISEPVASATQNVRKLQEIIDKTEPYDYIKMQGSEIMNELNLKLESYRTTFKEKSLIKAEADKCFELARPLHIHLLVKILRGEMECKSNESVKALLKTDMFHKILITICVEIVLNAYNSQLKFPWVLECFDVKPFDFQRLIENVVKRQQNILPRDSIKHLNYSEETCLESLSWKSDSAIWTEVEHRNARLPSCEDVEPSPIECGRDPSRRENVLILIFLRKFYKLAWMRLKELCKDLELGDEIHMTKIWTLFEYSITHEPYLMRDRHLDQLLMVATYIYIRVVGIQEKTFKDIMMMYRKQPQAASNIYRDVLIANDEKGDIINFYNKVYVQKMTPYALRYNENRLQDDLLLSPHPTEPPNLPKQLSNQICIYPLEKNEVKFSPNNITYEFHKSPAKDLDKMNEYVRSKYKRNLTLTFDVEEDRGEAKIRRKAGGLHLQEKIVAINNDRQAEPKI